MVGSSGIKASSWKAAAQLRAIALGRVYAILIAGMVYNFLRWGRWDGDDSTKFGEIKVGEKDGKTQALNVFAWTGVPRGMRATGVMDILEGIRAQKTVGATIGNATHSIIASQLHPAEGPIVSAGHMLATGKSIIGQDLRRKHQPGVEDEHAPYFRVAITNANPTAATLLGLDRPRQEVPMDERFWKLLGPWGVKTRRQIPFQTQNALEDRRNRMN